MLVINSQSGEVKARTLFHQFGNQNVISVRVLLKTILQFLRYKSLDPRLVVLMEWQT